MSFNSQCQLKSKTAFSLNSQERGDNPSPILGPTSGPHAVGEFTGTDHVFQKDNFIDLNKNGKLDGRAIVAADFGSGENGPTFAKDLPVGPLTNVTIESAQSAFSNVMAHAGCSLRRDAVDARLIEQVKSLGGRGEIIHSERDNEALSH